MITGKLNGLTSQYRGISINYGARNSRGSTLVPGITVGDVVTRVIDGYGSSYYAIFSYSVVGEFSIFTVHYAKMIASE